MHLAVVLLTMLVLPFASVVAHFDTGPSLPALIGQWFLFWAGGVRLATAGVRQIAAPGLTLEGIFGVTDQRARPLVRELGVWNCTVGILAMVSLGRPDWCLPLALASGCFYAAAGAGHLISSDRSFGQNISMVSDLGAAAVLLGFAAWMLAAAKPAI